MDLSHGSLVGAIVIGGVASLATGFIVGNLLARPLPTYQLMVQSFFGSLLTWLITALLTGSLVSLWLNTEASIATPIAACCLGLIVGTILWLCRRRPERRWAVISALVPWGIVSIGSAIAYFYFQAQPDRGSEKIPALFWSCIFYSMALSTIFGACLGGLIFHQTRHLRQFTSEEVDRLEADLQDAALQEPATVTAQKVTTRKISAQKVAARKISARKMSARKMSAQKVSTQKVSDPLPDPDAAIQPPAKAQKPAIQNPDPPESTPTQRQQKSVKKPRKKIPFDDFEHF
jgi:hypothetical protein